MALSLCKHTFPVHPPLGFMDRPGDCTGCGITHAEHLRRIEEEEGRRRLAGATRGRCEGCRHPDRMLFTFAPDPCGWDIDVGELRLCTQCWSLAKQADERGEPITFDQAFNHASDDQLISFLGWGT